MRNIRGERIMANSKEESMNASTLLQPFTGFSFSFPIRLESPQTKWQGHRQKSPKILC